MKAKLEDIPSQKGNSSCIAYRLQVPYFEFKWHYHPEYELTYILKGRGFRMVGNSYEPFTAGDLVLLGSNLPHTWSGKWEEDVSSEAIVIQFSNEFSSLLSGIQEMVSVQHLLDSAARGLCFDPEPELVDQMIELTEAHGVDKILKLLGILKVLAQKSNRQIAPNTFHTIVSSKSAMRINKVCQFIQSHFCEVITLVQVAQLIHLSESNFCKFFKKATGTTFSDYLNEMRINEASRLLLLTDKTISQVAFECGFETLSYFNRVFKRKKRKTPNEFRKAHLILS